jgi:RNA polymerase sigma factor (sigma-70 family)
MGNSVADLGETQLDEILIAAQNDASDDSEAMNEIVRRFQRRAANLARTLTRRAEVHDDLQQAALIALVTAVRRHDPTRAGFVTYAGGYMLGAARRELSNWTGQMPDSLSEPSVWAAACAVAAVSPEPGLHCWGYGRAACAVSGLPERQRVLLHRRYVEDVLLTVMAVEAGTSVPAVSQRLALARRAVAARLAA